MTEDSIKRSLEDYPSDNRFFDDWVQKNVTDQNGKVAIVTGSNSGTGFWCASALAGAGATVILACRSVPKAEAAKKEILESHPKAIVDVIPFDSSDFQVVRKFAQTFDAKYDRLDILCNNAGVMGLPYSLSKDGYEIQFQTNHLGHFLLTKLLWKKLVHDTEGQGRIIQHASIAHSALSPSFDKDHMEHPKCGWFGRNMAKIVLPLLGVGPVDAFHRYAVSKLCNVLFMKRLAEEIESKGLEDKVISLACHPGGAAKTGNLVRAGEAGFIPKWMQLNPVGAVSAAEGSLPLLFCCVGTSTTTQNKLHVKNGAYYGPSMMTSQPCEGAIGGSGNDKKQAESLWEYSEQCIGEMFAW